MRIATFNCNSIRARLPIVLDWLRDHSPDVLALQETKATDKDFPAGAFTDSGWHVAFRGEKSYNGVAVVTKKEPDDVSFGLGDDDGESETRLARVRIGKVTVVNTYVPQGRALDSGMFVFKLKWLGRLRDYFERHFADGKAPLIWVGDLNVARHPVDVYDSKAVWPHVCHCQEVIDAFSAVTEWGFEDIFRKHIPEAERFTFWDYRQRGALERNRGWRIDHILASEPIAKKSTGCVVDLEPRRAGRPSDHTFVYADFK
ncbi:MAG: exodeoxyribonuclease III [Planctomycetota bacterium]|jgi:exodeoxyribonuclease-3|nr:exodeoxyribonuclease III [Planctomycetota bacterium]